MSSIHLLDLELEDKKQHKESEKFKKKQKEIVGLAISYLEENGEINMAKFRKEQPSAYSRLNYYFQGVGGLLEELKKHHDRLEAIHKKASGRGCPINAKSVRNELAIDMLLLLRKNYTLHEIGEMYGVSRSHIHQLIQSMEKTTYLDERPVSLEMLM